MRSTTSRSPTARARARLGAEAAEVTHDGTFPGFEPNAEATAAKAFDPATAELDPASGGSALADAFAEADAHGVGGSRHLDRRGAGPGLGDR